MASYSWKTAPSWMRFVAGDLTNHKNQEVVKLADTVLDNKSGGHTPYAGNTTPMKDDCDLQFVQGNMFTKDSAQSDVCKVSINAGSEHYSCAEMKLNPSSWINNYKAVAFEYHQDSSRNNSIFLRRVSSIWYHAKENKYRGWGWPGDYESNKETVGYFQLYHDFRNTDEISWQTMDWRFHSLMFEFRTTSGVGSSFVSTVKFFNLKLYTGAYTNSSTPRFLIPRFRTFRDALATPTW